MSLASNDTVFWSVTSAVGGWLAAQFTAVVRDYVYRWRLKSKIADEVRQLYDETARIWINFARALQAYGAGVLEGDVPMKLATPIYSTHYPQAALAWFSRVQRTHVQMTYGYVDHLNGRLDSISKLLNEYHGKEMTPADIERVGTVLRTAARTLIQARWHLWYYSTHPKFPILEFNTEKHREYAEYIKDGDERIEEFIKSGAKLKPEDFLTKDEASRLVPPDPEAKVQGSDPSDGTNGGRAEAEGRSNGVNSTRG